MAKQHPLRVYISGAITGLDEKVVAEYFGQMTERVRAAGHVAVNPLEIAPFNPTWKWEDYMDVCIDAVFQCDVIVLLDNWNGSKGARCEKRIAERRGMPIYFPNDHAKLLGEVVTTETIQQPVTA